MKTHTMEKTLFRSHDSTLFAKGCLEKSLESIFECITFLFNWIYTFIYFFEVVGGGIAS